MNDISDIRLLTPVSFSSEIWTVCLYKSTSISYKASNWFCC